MVPGFQLSGKASCLDLPEEFQWNMVDRVALPVPTILAQSVSHPPSTVPEGKALTEASKKLNFRDRQRAFATL